MKKEFKMLCTMCFVNAIAIIFNDPFFIFEKVYNRNVSKEMIESSKSFPTSL